MRLTARQASPSEFGGPLIMNVRQEMTALCDLLRSNGVSRTLSPNNDLFRQEEIIREVYLLDEGSIKMTRMEYTGNEMVIEICEAPYILGAIPILANAPSTVTATSLTKCSIYCISAHSFYSLIDKNLGLSKSFLRLISLYSSDLIVRQAQLGIIPSRCRLAKVLLSYLMSQGPHKNGIIKVNLPVKKADLAGLLAVRPEQLSRLLAVLESRKVIKQDDGWIIVLDLESLAREAKV
jgi:CRP/FNR family transcriptional regulator